MSENLPEGYIIDPETYYLTPSSTNKHDTFTGKQKMLFIESFKKNGNLTRSAQLAGVTRIDVTKAFEIDSVFYRAFKTTVDGLCDMVEENLLKMTKNNPTACLKFLNAYRREVWGDRKTDDKAKANSKLKQLLDEAQKKGK